MLALGASDCEALRDGLLGQPVNAVSSLAYVAAGLWVLRRGGPAGPAVALGLVGVGSVLYHGPMPPGAGLAHDGSIAALAGAVAVVAWRRRGLPRPPVLAVGALGAAVAVNLLTRTGAPLCRPSSLLQGHGAWHVLTAVAAASWLAAWPPPPPPPRTHPRDPAPDGDARPAARGSGKRGGEPPGATVGCPRMELRHVRLTDPLGAPLLAGLAREYDVRYGETDEMVTVAAEEFDPPSGTFLVLIDGGEVLAGGGLRRVADDTCEVKRMWTAAGHRRKGYASRVLTGLEDAARVAGYSTVLLETGPLQPEAIALYTGRGYRRIPYYGRYSQALAFRFDLRSSASRGIRGRPGA